jgi:hypothetical protein
MVSPSFGVISYYPDYLLCRYGGTLLGPARFSHVETCASEACREFKRTEALRECVATLKTLDIVLDELRLEYRNNVSANPSPCEPVSSQSELNSQTIPTPSGSKDYSNIDLQKGKRLIKAREKAIKSVKLLLTKRCRSVASAGQGEQ